MYDSPSGRSDGISLRMRLFLGLLAAVAVTLEFLDDTYASLT